MGNILTTFTDLLLHRCVAQPQPQMQMPRRRGPGGGWSRQEIDILEAYAVGAGAGGRVGSEVFWRGCHIPGRTDKAKRDQWRRLRLRRRP